jgi:hypothetical protein
MDSERPVMAAQSTGDSRVDEAIAGLAGLGDLPLDEHPAVLEAVHASLREILGELETSGRPGTPGQQGELGGGQLGGGQLGGGQRR